MASDMNEFFKGVVWARQRMDEQHNGLWRYAVSGLLVRETPLVELNSFRHSEQPGDPTSGITEAMVEGPTFGGLGDLLNVLPRRAPNHVIGEVGNLFPSLKWL